MNRRLYIDWLRGVAVLCMIEWHSIDSWTLREGRETSGFAVAIFFGGWAAPLFLFLAGLSLPLAGAGRVARGGSRAAASWSLQTRGWQVFLIAHLFRLQSFLLNPNGSWNGLLKPDILNVLGLSIVAVSFCWGRSSESRRSMMAWLLGPGLVIAAVVTPLAATWWWPTLLPPRLEAYIRPVGNNGVFSLFPCMAYVFLGAFAGAVMASAPESDRQTHLRLLGWGALLIAAGSLLDSSRGHLPSALQFWAGTPAVVSWRVGSMLVALIAVWAWLRWRPATSWTPLVLLGRTSLFVYWVHVELAYGNFSFPLHGVLPLSWSVVAYGLFAVGMYGLAVLWARRPAGRPLVPVHMNADLTV